MFVSAKVLVTSGSGKNNQNQLRNEIIDLKNPRANCELKNKFMDDRYGAVGGLLNYKHILKCGGSRNFLALKDCLVVGNPNITGNMLVERTGMP